MSTTVHLPPELLHSVDQRARELGLSRNRYIIRALERMAEHETQWSSTFVEELEKAALDRESGEALQDLRNAVAEHRSSKSAPTL